MAVSGRPPAMGGCLRRHRTGDRSDRLSPGDAHPRGFVHEKARERGLIPGVPTGLEIRTEVRLILRNQCFTERKTFHDLASHRLREANLDRLSSDALSQLAPLTSDRPKLGEFRD